MRFNYKLFSFLTLFVPSLGACSFAEHLDGVSDPQRLRFASDLPPEKPLGGMRIAFFCF